MTPLEDAVTLALIHSLWQDTLIGVVLAASLFGLRRRSAQARYGVSCVALAVMSLLPVVTGGIAYRAADRPAPRGGSASTVPMPEYSPETAARPADGPVSYSWPAQWIAAAQPWALPLWIGGVLLFSLRGLLAGTQAAALQRRCEPADAATAAVVERLAARLGVNRPVRALLSPVTDGPATLGWWHPVILLPPATALGVTPHQLEALLAHELAHIRRHDYLVNVVQMVVETAFFYHPAVWWASRRIRIERELCCDDAAVSVSGDPIDYARALTAVARIQVGAPFLAVPARGGALLHRIQRLVQPRAGRQTVSRWPGLIALLMVLAAATSVSARWLEQRAATERRGGAVWGYVYDPLGERAAGITMTLDNNVTIEAKGPFGPPLVIEAKTDAFGFYRFDNVPPGAYVLSPVVDWAKTTTIYAPPDGSVQHDVWIAFDIVNASLWANKDRPQPVVPPLAEVNDPSRAVMGPRVLTNGNIPFPADVRASGDVVLEGHIGADGLARGLRVISANEPELARAALAAAREQRWQPARVRGTPLEVPVRITAVYRVGLN